MGQGGLAAHWFRVAQLTPRLRAQARIHRTVARGQIWYVLQDEQTGRYFRISPSANLMLCLMNGRRTIAEIWGIVSEKLGPERPTQDETIRLLIQLYQSDLLRTTLPPDMAELARRADRLEQKRWRGWFTSPMAMRFPLLDPDRFLNATMPLFRPLFTRTAFVLWMILVMSGLATAALHFHALTANVSDRVFTTYNVLMIALLYPVSKALHELGHAYATKAGGGEVHEMGIMLLVFFPVPYVDCSASSAFRERWRRVLVASAGIMVELSLAALAVFAWVYLPQGPWRAAAFNLMLLCSVSTVVFNANPLLRFDGYFVLSDLLGIPNLDKRASGYLLYLIQHKAFGMHDVESPVEAPGEANWLVAYGIASFLYRVAVMIGIATLVAQRFFALGVILAMVVLFQMVALPTWRGARFVLTNRQLGWRRKRALAACGGVVATVALLLLAVPLPYSEVAQGVLWIPDDAVVRARADGFVQALLVEPGSEVAAGQPVAKLEDPVAAAQVEVMQARLEVARSRFEAVNLLDLVEARLAAEQLERARAALARIKERSRDLVLVAQRPGRFVVPGQHRIDGKFIHNGEVLGYVIGAGDVEVRAVVDQANIDMVRSRTRGAAVRFTESIERQATGEIVRETPSALERPPAPALAAEAGGPMLLDPTSPSHDRPLDSWYEIAVRVAGDQLPQRIGSRAFVRFDLGVEPIGWRLFRSARQTLLHLMEI
jgi:putative peptide zinc metalloprotease protein